MEQKSPLAQMLEELYSTLHQPYPFRQVWPLLPLFFIRLFSAGGYVLSILGLIPASVYGGMDWFFNCLTAVCLFLLIRATSRYRTAAIFMVIAIGLSILSAILGRPMMWDVLSAMCVLAANFFEYTSHAIIAVRQSGRLANYWDRLFLFAFFAVFAGAFAFMVTLVLSYIAPEFSILSVIISYAPDLLVDILYLIYMAMTLRLILKAERAQNKGENYGA